MRNDWLQIVIRNIFHLFSGSESPLRSVDVNGDGVMDVLFGVTYSQDKVDKTTSKCTVYQGIKAYIIQYEYYTRVPKILCWYIDVWIDHFYMPSPVSAFCYLLGLGLLFISETATITHVILDHSTWKGLLVPNSYIYLVHPLTIELSACKQSPYHHLWCLSLQKVVAVVY